MTATYYCDDGFVSISDNMSRACEADGNFSRNMIECERIFCGSVPLVEHGSPNISKGYFEDRVFYQCDPG